jgi:hypothetical protein
MVAEGDPARFVKFFEDINPEHAEILYAELVGEVVRDARWREYVRIWSDMRASGVARIIEEMIYFELPLIMDVLWEMGESDRRRILDALDTEYAGLILRTMNPQ